MSGNFHATKNFILKSSLIGLFPSTVKTILPARIRFRYIQQEQILALMGRKLSNKNPIQLFRQMSQQKGADIPQGSFNGG